MKERFDTIISWVGLAYLVLAFLAVPLHGKALLCDCLAPVMLWQCWRKRRELLESLRGWSASKFLSIALGWMALSTLVHVIQGTCAVFDLAVFLYMGMLFAFYRFTPLPSAKQCAAAGGILLGMTFVGYLVTKCMDVRGTCLEGLIYFDKHFALLEPNALVTRYQFLTTNPNLLGGAYILPGLLLLPTLQDALQKRNIRDFVIAVVLTLLGILPLLGTASKMSVMTFGLLAGAYASIPFLAPIRPRILATIAVTAFGLLCLTTVLFQTYPALQEAPWVDFTKRGNYSVHQEIYLKIIRDGGARGVLFGHAPQELHGLYPQYADEGHIREILEPYGFGQDAPLYCTFMDPHNEYLNTASFFGLPALLGLLAFLLVLLVRSIQSRELPLALLVLGVFFCFFWEDAASKRSLWIALGIVASCIRSPKGNPKI